MKRASTLILCLALLLALALPAGAEQQQELLYPLTRVDDSALYLAVQPTEEGTLSVTVNGQSFKDYRVTTVEEAQLPITYYCIVDQSSSFSNSQKQHQKRGLTALSDSLRSIDSMELVLMGEAVSFGDPLTTPEERQQGIEEACVYSARFTNLNDSIVTVIDTVTRIQDENSLSCIILFTDGLDNARIEVGFHQVWQAVAESHLSFNVVSLVDPWAEQFARNNAARVGIFAEASLSGVSKTPSQDYDSPTCVEDDMAEIMAQALSITVIALDVSALPRTENTLNIGVTCTQGRNRSTASRSVDAAQLPSPPAPTQPETLPPETTQPETTQTLPPETTQPETTAPTETTPPVHIPSLGGKSRMLPILLVVGAGLLLFLIVLAVLLRYNQRSLEEPDVDPDPEPKPKKERHRGNPSFSEEDDWEKLDISELTVQKNKPASKPDLKLDFGQQPKPELQNEPDRKSPGPLPRKELPKRGTTPGCKVRLVPMDHPEDAIEFFIGVNESVTLGRNKRSDITLNETDTALSGLHFELQWDSRVLHLRDRKSTNGTALNGVPLRPEGWVRVTGNAVIQAGSDRYAVTVEKK